MVGGNSGWSYWCGPWLDGRGRLEIGLGKGHGWEYREAFYRRLDGGSMGRGLLRGSLLQILKKRDSPWF